MSNFMPSKAEKEGLKNLKSEVLGGGTSVSDFLRKGDYVPEMFFIG